MARKVISAMTRVRTFGAQTAALVAIAVAIAACGIGGATATPSAAVPTLAASAAASAAPATPGGPITLDAPAQVKRGAEFSVAWTGPIVLGDYVTVVAKGATKVATNAAYVNITVGSPGTLLAPPTAGDYELWLVKGDTLGDLPEFIKARRPLSVQ
jgi:hypothetical protein